VVAAPIVAAQEPPRSKAFAAQIQKQLDAEPPPSTEALWPLVGRCAVELQRPRPQPDTLDFSLEAACHRAAERLGREAPGPRRWRLGDSLPADLDLRRGLLDGILEARMSAAMRALPAAPERSRRPPGPSAAPLPKHLADAPPELQAAWRAFDALRALAPA